MLRSMYGRSRSSSAGATTKRWTSEGQTTPAKSAAAIHSPTAAMISRIAWVRLGSRMVNSMRRPAMTATPAMSRSAGTRAVTSA